MAESISVPQEMKAEAMSDLKASEELKVKEAEEQTEVQNINAMVSVSESNPEEVSATSPTVEEKGKGKETSVDANAMEFITESEPREQDSVTNPSAKEKGKCKEQLVEHASSIDPVSEGGPEGEVMDIQSDGQIEQVNVHDLFEGQDTRPGPSNEMAPPLAPFPQDPSSETVSIIASSISNPVLEVDNAFDVLSDTDSAIDDVRQQSSTGSVRSSIYDFVEENGRTFHRYKEGKYVLPNDEIEQDRLDLQHQMILILLDGKLHLAPINPDLQYVLDVGTGTGIWAIEFAMKYPSASVIGTDLSPIQPEFVPPNCQFEVDDAEDEWMFNRPFDFIHMRGTMTCFRDPKDILTKAFDAVAPGCYVEMQDSIFPMYCHDDTLDGTALDVWGKACVEAGVKMGRPWTSAVHYRRWMEEIGYEDVKEKRFEVATSTWPKGKKQKELGLWWQADLLDALGASMAVLTRGLGWEPAEVERLLVDVRKDIKNREVHAFMPIYVIYGMKPKESESAGTI